MTINREHLATQKILDLILDECRYWQGRDEARRGSFAILYAAAKEIAAQAQAAPEAEPVVDVSGIGRDADHPRAVVLYLRTEPSDDDMRAIQNALRTAPQHDAELIELLRAVRDCGNYAAIPDEVTDCIDAKLATLSAKP